MMRKGSFCTKMSKTFRQTSHQRSAQFVMGKSKRKPHWDTTHTRQKHVQKQEVDDPKSIQGCGALGTPTHCGCVKQFSHTTGVCGFPTKLDARWPCEPPHPSLGVHREKRKLSSHPNLCAFCLSWPLAGSLPPSCCAGDRGDDMAHLYQELVLDNKKQLWIHITVEFIFQVHKVPYCMFY